MVLMAATVAAAAAAVVGREQWCLLPSLLEGSLVGRGGKAQGDGRARGEPGKAQGSQRTETGFTHDYGQRDTLDVRASETRELEISSPQETRWPSLILTV